MHALIIEDEALVAIAIEDALADCGFSSFTFASSFAGAIEAAKQRCPDLITADVRLAPGCGIDAVEAICEARPRPVVFITASPSEVEQRSPSHVIVCKPFLPAQVAAAVRMVTELYSGSPDPARVRPLGEDESPSSPPVRR